MPAFRKKTARKNRRASQPRPYRPSLEALEERTLLDAGSLLFDFGTATSAVAVGAQAVVPPSVYDGSMGFGYENSNPQARARSGGDALTHDFHFASQLTFLVDVADGTYDVTLTMGDLDFGHDQMGVLLEGQQVDTVTTAAGEVLSLSYTVNVNDGQLTLQLIDQGGPDGNVVLNGLEVTGPAPDVTGPSVVGMTPSESTLGAVDRVLLTFSEDIDADTFDVGDVAILGGSQGSIAPLNVNQLAGNQFEVVFDPQSEAGSYQVSVGPDVEDLAGNAMDQDGDGVNGEAGEDVFTGAFDLVTEKTFDFGTPTSAVESGAQQVLPEAFDPFTGFGYVGALPAATERSGGTDLNRDFHFGSSLTFAVGAVNGTYDVTVTIGDLSFAHDEMALSLEGQQVGVISTAAGEILTLTYQVSVDDGQFTLDLTDLGGSDGNVVLNGLTLARQEIVSEPGPRVVSAAPAERVLGAIDRFTVTFDKAILDGSFTLEDVVSIVGPRGTIEAVAVNKITDVQYEVVFAAQTRKGDYTITLGPDVLDEQGNPMDQDGDGVNGEAVEDQFTGTVELVRKLKFDFGTESSRVAPRAEQVLATDAYTAERGYGYVGSLPEAIARDKGSALKHDFHAAPSLTFAVDAANGVYEVTLVVGDSAQRHDRMKISLEGHRVGVVSTRAGKCKTLTYRVKVRDGQLTLRMDDLGGRDPNVVLNGLKVKRLNCPKVSKCKPCGRTHHAKPSKVHKIVRHVQSFLALVKSSYQSCWSGPTRWWR